MLGKPRAAPRVALVAFFVALVGSMPSSPRRPTTSAASRAAWSTRPSSGNDLKKLLDRNGGDKDLLACGGVFSGPFQTQMIAYELGIHGIEVGWRVTRRPASCSAPGPSPTAARDQAHRQPVPADRSLRQVAPADRAPEPGRPLARRRAPPRPPHASLKSAADPHGIRRLAPSSSSACRVVPEGRGGPDRGAAGAGGVCALAPHPRARRGAVDGRGPVDRNRRSRCSTSRAR